MRYFILVCVYLCAGLQCAGQVIQPDDIDVYTTKSGLPNNSVLSLCQDSKGFLWIGTFDGLSRYDGHEFKLYSKKIYDKDGIGTFSVDAITEDKKNNIWIGTRAGVGQYNNRTRQWQFNQEESLHSVLCFHEDTYGNMWYGTVGGDIGILSHDSLQSDWKVEVQGAVRSICQYNERRVLILSSGLYLLDVPTRELQELRLPGIDISNRNLQTNGKQILSISQDGTVMMHDIQTNSTTRIYTDEDIREHNFCKIFISGDSLFFIVTRNTIKEISKRGELLNSFHSTDVTAPANNITINFVSKDMASIIWIGTNNGLIKINNDKQLFREYHSGLKENNIKHNYIRALCADSNILWVGTRYGEIGKLYFDKRENNIIKQQWYPVNNSTTYITNVIKITGDKTVWAGCENGVFYLDKNATGFRQFITENRLLRNMTEIWDITEDTTGRLWVGTRQNGLYIINPANRQVEHYKIRPGNEHSTAIWSIYKDTSGRMWLGTSNGLYLAGYDKRGLLIFNKNYIKGSVQINGLHVWPICQNKTNLWIGTTDYGLSKLDLLTGKIKNYSTMNGLPGNTIGSLISDNRGDLWISTLNGISKFNTRTGQFINYNEEDGLISNDYNFKAVAKTYDGTLFFGSKIGITSFNPEKIPVLGPGNANIVISSVTVSGIEYGDYISDTGEITLSYKDNNISLRFAVLDFRKPRSHHYRFILHKFENQWHNTAVENPTTVYTNLGPGTYIFELQASVDGSTWAGKPTKLHIYIKPAIWQTIWFRVAILFLFIALAAFLVFRRFQFVINREREQNKTDKKIAELEMTALRAQMNPHFIFNAISSIQHYIISKDAATANEYLAKFAKLIRLFLDSSRNKYIKPEDEIMLLSLYIELEKLRFEDKFDYRININKQVNTSFMFIPSMIIQPIVENAIIHGLVHLVGKKGWLEITMNEKDNLLECVIEDNGIGRENAQQFNSGDKAGHTSVGMTIINERIAAYKYLDKNITMEITDKKDEYNRPAGTKVTIVLPLIKQA